MIPKLSQIDDELFEALEKSFQNKILALEAGNCATWYDYYTLGLELYEFGEALWQVFGTNNYQRQTQQAVHFDMAGYAFGNAAIVVVSTPGPDRPEDKARLDVLSCMQAVAKASLMRTYSQTNEIPEIIESVLGTSTSPGIANRCLNRAQEEGTVQQQQFAAAACALGYRLAGGEAFGFPPPQNEGKAAYLQHQALNLFRAGAAGTLDGEYIYRGLLLDAALQAHAQGDSAVRRMYARRARESAKLHNHRSHALRAWLVGQFGSHGNRLWCGLTLVGMRG